LFLHNSYNNEISLLAENGENMKHWLFCKKKECQKPVSQAFVLSVLLVLDYIFLTVKQL